MKIRLPSSHPRRRIPSGSQNGFTLPELLIASSLFILVVGGVITAHLFGLRMFQIMEVKLNATAGARKTIGQLTDEVRRANKIMIGNLSGTNFEALLDGEPQQGNGLLIQPTADTNDFVIYFVNPSDETFRRTASASDSTSILAESVTNAIVFQSVDFSGNLMTNRSRLVHMNIEFYQPEGPLQPAQYYRLETCVTRRTSNQP